MKKLSLSILFISSILSAESALLNVSYTGVNMDYREFDVDGSILDSEKSSFKINGIDTSLELELHNGFTRTSLMMSYLYMKGETEYVGSLLGGPGVYGSVVSTTQNTITQPEVYLKEAVIRNNTELYVGAGGGHKLWKRALSVDQVEDYEWFYLKGNIGFLHQFDNNICIGAEYAYTKALSPKMIAYGNPDLVFNLGSVYSHSIIVPIVIPISRKVDLRIETKYEKLTINESDTNSGYYEPDSKTINIYSKIGLDVHF